VNVTDPGVRVPATVLIVGAGLAGLRTAAELRERGFAGRLVVVGAERHQPYDRPPLSKELLTRTDPAWLAADGLGTLGDLADEVLLAHAATALRAGEDGAELDVAGAGGMRTLTADVAVLATGAHAVAPRPWEGVLTLHTADDAAHLRERLQPGRRLVVIGAGWIGAEVSGLAAAHGLDVTVVEAAAAPLARQVGTTVGARVAPWYEAAGVRLLCPAPVRAVQEEGDVRTVVLDGRQPLKADVVLAATGVRPATGWLGAALPTTASGAVPVDAAGRVPGGPPSVRAVGDCAQMTTAELGTVPGGHWDAALTHPAALAAGLLGQDLPAIPAPYVFSTQLGHDVAVVGHPSPTAAVVDRSDGESWTALYVEHEDDAAARLVAGFTADRPRDVGQLRRLLAGGGSPRLDLAAAADPAVPLKKAVLP